MKMFSRPVAGGGEVKQARRLLRRRNWWSLSCYMAYMAQSVICAPLLSAWGLGLGGVLGSAGLAVFAVGVWLVILVLAYAQERAGQRGPAEVLLRRLVYRRPN